MAQARAAAVGGAMSLDEIAAEIARAEALLAEDIARDIEAVQSRTAEFAATERREEREWTTTTTTRGAGHSEQQRGMAELTKGEEGVEDGAEGHTQAESAQQTRPLRAWETTDRAAGEATTATSPAASPTRADGARTQQRGRPERPRPSGNMFSERSRSGESSRRPRSAPRRQHLPREGAPDRRYRPSREELERQAREKLDKECTFKPNSSRRRTRKAPANAGMSRQERIDNLAKSKVNLWRKREQQRIENAEKEAQQCTFEPKVTAGKKAGAATQRGDSSRAGGADGASSSVTDRLYHEADGRMAHRQRLKREKEAAELSRLQFAPTVNSSSTSTTDTGSSEPRLHERISELQRSKSEKLARMRNEVQAANKDLTFKPHVPAATRKIVAGRTAAAATGKRSAKQEAADNARKARLARAAEVQRQELEALPFKPALPSRSEELAASNPAFKGEQGADFIKRSRLFERRRAEQAATASEEAAEKAASTQPFQPVIPTRSAKLVQSQEGRRDETLTDKLVRLTYGDAQHRDEVTALATAEFYGQYSFEPEVGPKPHGKEGRGPQPTPLDELVSGAAIEAARARAAEEAEEQWKQSHTFRPSLDEVSKRLAELSQPSRAVRFLEPENLVQAIEAERERKARKIEQSRSSLEYEDLKRCTFRPQTNENAPPPANTSGAAASRGSGASSPPADQSKATRTGVPSRDNTAPVVPEVGRRPRRSSTPVIVRGLGRHLELQEAAKRKEQLAEERAEEAFSVKKSALEGRTGLYTVPQPFVLSTDRRIKERTRQMEEDILARMGERTETARGFDEEWGRPQTNARVDQSLLDRVMNTTDSTEMHLGTAH